MLRIAFAMPGLPTRGPPPAYTPQPPETAYQQTTPNINSSEYNTAYFQDAQTRAEQGEAAQYFVERQRSDIMSQIDSRIISELRSG